MKLFKKGTIIFGVLLALTGVAFFSYGTFRGERCDRFHQACWDGDIQRVKFWLALGADPTGRYDLHYSSNAGEPSVPLIDAAECGKPEIIQLLLAAGANVNQRDGEGDTALVVAIIKNHPDVVRVLVDAGAITAWNHDSALAIAKRLGRPEIVSYLQLRQGR